MYELKSTLSVLNFAPIFFFTWAGSNRSEDRGGREVKSGGEGEGHKFQIWFDGAIKPHSHL